ncbi:unnamed protein product, partial [Brassica rapa]
SPRGPKSPKQSTGRASVQSPRTNVLICVLMDSHRRPVYVLCVLADSHKQPQTSCVCWRTPMDVLCVLNRQPTWDKITQTVHRKGQRADMCTEGQPRTSHTDGHTRTATDVLCVLVDTHGRPVQPTWDKITQTVHGKGQRAESKDQRADMCTEGQPRMSYVPRGIKSPKQSTGRASVLSPRTNVLICVLRDSHGRPVCADGHRRTHTDSHGRPVQPTWAKITQTVHGKGQCAESKDQRANMYTDGQPQIHTRTATDVLCVLADTHGRPVCTEQIAHPRTCCVCWRTPMDVLCVLNRQPTWDKITQTVHGKGQHAESKDQRADMCTEGQPWTTCVYTHGHTRTATNVMCVLTDTHERPVCADGQPQMSCVHGRPVCADGHTRTAMDLLCVLVDTHGRPVCTEQIAHVGQNHPNSPREGPACRVQGPTCDM